MVAKTRRAVGLSRLDAKLRQESPAYAPDASWEGGGPQGMSVVLSVRFDPVSARRLAQQARREQRTPSALVREWTLQHLAAPAGDATTRAIGEARAIYQATADLESLRERYRPSRIRVLLVGESRPSGGTFFYLANSRLFFATREAFIRARGSAPGGEEFLSTLQRDGVWLYDLAPTPVNRLSGRPRRAEVEARTAGLAGLLRDANGPMVVTVKRSLEPVVRASMASAGLEPSNLMVLPFPLYQWREEYVGGLARILGEMDLAAGAAARTRGTRRDELERRRH